MNAVACSRTLAWSAARSPAWSAAQSRGENLAGGDAIPAYGLRPMPGYGRRPEPGCRGLAPRGFTLMETLVMLLLVSFASALMFQMLGSYRIARERVLVQGEFVNAEALLENWFADSVRGLHPVGSRPLQGDESSLESTTLNPLFGPRGTPAGIAWRLERDEAGRWLLVYVESGAERFAEPLRDQAGARLLYLDGEGTLHTRWPTALGEQGGLPEAVALERSGVDGRRRVWLASVLGPLSERIELYQPEED